jgi:hypothetical protein
MLTVVSFAIVGNVSYVVLNSTALFYCRTKFQFIILLFPIKSKPDELVARLPSYFVSLRIISLITVGSFPNFSFYISFQGPDIRISAVGPTSILDTVTLVAGSQ